jgi:hydantoinase/carbamoylase family amidase
VLRVDADRLRADFDALAAIGATPEGGVHRPALGEANLAARRWFLDRAAAAGLDTRIDSAGNHSAVLAAASPGAPTLLLGSHLDSVPNGGRFDGALGVVAALEVLRTVKDARLGLPVALEAIDFTDEEGTLVGLLGSYASAGMLRPDVLAAPRGGREVMTAGLARAGLVEERLADARRDPASLAGYLELHIEQGPVLERDGADVGVVTGIVGSRSFRLVFVGAAAHAGTTPMDARRDAALGAARFVASVPELVGPGCVATVGSMEVAPGAFNVVAASVRLSLEFRSLDPERLDALERVLLDRAGAEAERAGLELHVEPVGRWEPTPLDPDARAAIAHAASRLGLRTLELASGAGHDAQALATVTRSGMIFVPSRSGISHQPAEHTDWTDCVNGANVLLGAALELVGSDPLTQ